MDVPEVEGMEHVGWYLPTRKHPQERFWPKSLEPNDWWTQPVIPLYAPALLPQPTDNDMGEHSDEAQGAGA